MVVGQETNVLLVKSPFLLLLLSYLTSRSYTTCSALRRHTKITTIKTTEDEDEVKKFVRKDFAKIICTPTL